MLMRTLARERTPSMTSFRHRRAPARSRLPQRRASFAGGKRQTRGMNEEGKKEEEEEALNQLERRINVQQSLSGPRQ